MEQSYGYMLLCCLSFWGLYFAKQVACQPNPTLSQDADGSGTLHVSELVHGLLKIRGDIKSHGLTFRRTKTWGCGGSDEIGGRQKRFHVFFQFSVPIHEECFLERQNPQNHRVVRDFC